MRLVAFMVAVFAASTPAAAQGWQEYDYPQETFTADFPAEPKVETTTYKAPGGRLVEAQVYSVVQAGGAFKVTVVDMSDTQESPGNIMAYAIFMLSRQGELKFNIAHATRRVIGRQAGIGGVDRLLVRMAQPDSAVRIEGGFETGWQLRLPQDLSRVFVVGPHRRI